MSADEHALLDAARTGDRRALEQLLALQRPRITAICRRMLRDQGDAEDASQEALIAIVRSIGRFDGRSSFSTWAHRITTNTCLDELRRRGRRPGGAPGEFDHVEGDAPDPADAAADSDERRQLVHALDQLSDEFRLPVVLRDVADLDYATIAEQLGVPIGTVRSRIARGRAQLAAVLDDPTERCGPDGNSTSPLVVGEIEPT